MAGGGSGGHVFPLIAITRELKRVLPGDVLDFCYLGPRDKVSKEYIEREGIRMKPIYSGKLRRYIGFLPVLRNIFDIAIKMPAGIVQSFFFLFFYSPDLILSKGGYGSFPVVLAGRLLRIPVFLHESDSAAGAANQFLQRFASEIFVSFPDTSGIKKEKMIITGNPVREEVLEGEKEKGKRLFGLRGEKPVLLILGGSQGSERINDLVLSISGKILEDFEVIHQCGAGNSKEVSAEVEAVITDKEKKEHYHVYPFLNEEKMKHAYECAELVVSRAGAGTIFELAAKGRAAVLLPLPESAQDHQAKNAYEYSASGAAIVLEEGNLTSHFFLERIKELFSPVKQIREMESNARGFSKPRAGYIIASYIKEYLTR